MREGYFGGFCRSWSIGAADSNRPGSIIGEKKPGMKDSEKTFQVLDTLHRQEISTQRQLADHSGISLGQVNYILKSLLKKGMVKVGNFRQNPNKIHYMYLLTPKGIETKSRLAVKFVVAKLKEYNRLREILADKLTKIKKEGHHRIIFVGPSTVKDFISSIIDERELEIILVGYYDNLKDMDNISSESFDIALVFEDISGGIREIEQTLNIPKGKLMTLW
jgi:EPS-associated MarR family transcriptional regulator